MKKCFSLLFFSLGLISLTNAQKPGKPAYQFNVDINNVVDDKLKVTLNVPAFNEPTLVYHIPKIVPGTYKIYDFGRFVSDFKATDKDGNQLTVNHLDDNSWEISNAQSLSTIEYWVEDTYDTDKPNQIFEPAGTEIKDGVSVVMNNHGFFGYFDKYQMIPYYITVDRPKNFYGATALKRIGGDEDTDIFTADTYNFLADGPILFCEPDTAWLKVASTNVLVSVFSPNHVVKASDIVKEVAPTLDAQRKYLGGNLPVDHYAFLIYLGDGGFASGAAGALEHSYSSFYCLPEMEPENIAQTVRDVAAHEFFHIVTPLSIHSEEIHYFNFIEPKMSRHLWMYEGQTEYAAHLAQIQGGMTDLEHFCNKIQEKLEVAKNFDDKLPFTELSLGCLDKHEPQYQNVYYKGALISMCLDLKLRNLSGGKYGLQHLMRDLSKEYGITKPFKDEELFGTIVRLCGYPEIEKFLNDYVADAKPLPIKEMLASAGIDYINGGTVKKLSPMFGIENPGVIGFDYALMRLKIADASKMDDFGRKYMKFKTGDVILQLNGEDLTAATINQVITSYVTSVKEGQKVSVLVMRKGKNVTLKSKLKKVKTKVDHMVKPMKKPSKAQLALRNSWLTAYAK